MYMRIVAPNLKCQLQRTMAGVRLAPYLQSVKFAYHGFMEAGRKCDVLESETKGFISQYSVVVCAGPSSSPKLQGTMWIA